ncbi:reverse transcriptase family protein [Rhizophagus irregularis DAOM 181602=DAOM 197198]|nr:reverse transcriptase family protein [Rhizophagus irregularis DAOM 181602=DAOM 197198]
MITSPMIFPLLLSLLYAIDQEVIDHFQNFVPITSTPPSSIQDLPERWSNAYTPLADVSPAIFDSLMDPPTLDEWSSTISSMPNDKAPDPSMISQATVIHISKAFDSVDLSMLRFALQRLRLPQNAIQFLLSLFMSHFNRVITAHGPIPPYRVRIGIDQGEVISPLLWVIYLDPLLTTLRNEKKDSYCLISPLAPYTVSSNSCSPDVLEINNLVFMDDSTLISSSKEGMEHMFH